MTVTVTVNPIGISAMYHKPLKQYQCMLNQYLLNERISYVLLETHVFWCPDGHSHICVCVCIFVYIKTYKYVYIIYTYMHIYLHFAIKTFIINI